MNIVKHRVYRLEFDVWEPQEKLVDKELQEAVYRIKTELKHAGNLKLNLVAEERV